MQQTLDFMTKNCFLKYMRKGPNPLPVHISLAIAAYTHQHAKDGDLSTQDEQHKEKLEAFFSGIQKYQNYSVKHNLIPLDVFMELGTVKVFVAPSHDENAKVPLILIPSMINKSTILDLMEDYSLMRWFADQGRDVYLVDWGNSLDDPGQESLDAVVTKRLVPILTEIRDYYSKPVHILGYCMGGLLSMAAAQMQAANIQSLTLMATPWDFHANNNAVYTHIQYWAPSGLAMTDQYGYLPVDWIQSVFANISASTIMQKFCDFAQMQEGSERADCFVAVEDWLNDGVNLPHKIAKTCIEDWYLGNKPYNKQWNIDTQCIDPQKIETPCLVVAAKTDRLVPLESSKILADQLPDADILEPDCGHIGLIVGRDAKRDVWQAIEKWLQKIEGM